MEVHKTEMTRLRAYCSLYMEIGNAEMKKQLIKIINCSEIGATGFEPATSRPPAVRATKLRHTPVRNIIARHVGFCKSFLYGYFTILRVFLKYFQKKMRIIQKYLCIIKGWIGSGRLKCVFLSWGKCSSLA